MYLSTGITKSIPNTFVILVQFFIIIAGSSIIQRNDDNENTEEDKDVKGMYILLSGTLAAVTSDVRGTMIPPVVVVDVRWSLYPEIHLLYDYNPVLASVSMPAEEILFLLHG